MATLLERCKKFEDSMRKYSDFGARDSEPMAYFKQLLLKKIQQPKPAILDISVNPAGWELYSIAGSKTAAKSLSKKMETLLKRCDNSPLNEVKEVIQWYGL